LVAGAIFAGAIVVAFALPMQACGSGERFVDPAGQPGGSPTCMTSYDTGYRPHGPLPIKITVAVGGAVVAVAIFLWRRRWLVAIGMLIAFAAIATAWFIPDGYVQTMRDGHPVCCGDVIHRGWLRTVVVVAGAGLGTMFVLLGLVHPRRLDDRKRPERRPSPETYRAGRRRNASGFEIERGE
jgi:hypothetical protein